ncbi:type II toxin-antitoxin system VapC family toxin [Aeoliella sp. SH292]|uniref:type II toxin-antitoxin system VapC family toxin n=1 Tax=Aeoliella sp. SH292 TaxID=3454464 RepID=UPI003F9CCB4E
MRVLIDTNILLRIANGQSDSQFHKAVEAVESLIAADHTLYVVPQNTYEFWSVATRPTSVNGLGMSKSEAQHSIETFIQFRMRQDERSIYPHWIALVEKYDISGKTTHDARLVAAMVRHRMERLLTFNSAHFARFDEIQVWTPEAVVAGGYS